MLGPSGGPALFAGWHDSELDVDCYADLAEDDTRRCLPFGQSMHIYFFDSSCSRPGVLPPLCGEPGFVSRWVRSDACGSSPSHRRIYEPASDATSVDTAYRIDSAGACIELTRNVPDTLVSIARMDPSRFVAMTRVRDDGGDGPIAVDRVVTADGASGPSYWRDRAHDWDCAGMPWEEDAPTPCVPDHRYGFRRPAATCDQPWELRPAGCAPPDYAVSYTSNGCGSESDFHVWTVEDRVSDAERAAAMCSFVAASDDAYHVRAADDEVSWISSEWTGTGRLQIATMVDSAGNELTRFAYQYFDTELGLPCFPADTTEGFLCVPGYGITDGVNAAPRVGLVFADAACTVPAALPSGACASGYAYARPTSGCDARMTAVYRVGDALDTTYQLDDSGACVVADATSYQGYAVTPVAFASLARIRSFTE